MVWNAARIVEDNVTLPDELHLYVTKINTGRHHGLYDIASLESLVKARFKERLAVCDLAEATVMLDRFLDPEALQHARTNPPPEKRALPLKYLKVYPAKDSSERNGMVQVGGLQQRPITRQAKTPTSVMLNGNF